MKKLSILLILALILPVLAGCQRAENNARSMPTVYGQPTETIPSAATNLPADTGAVSNVSGETAGFLPREEAIAIALKHAGLDSSKVRDLEVELDRDFGKTHYDVTFDKDGYDYEYEIDALTGEILHTEKERD